MVAEPLVPDRFSDFCQQVAAVYQIRRLAGYQPTVNQLFFFTAAVGRNGRTAPADGYDRFDPSEHDPACLATTAHAVAEELAGDSGAVVTALKRGDEQEWSAFWIRLRALARKLGRRYEHQLDGSLRDDALGQCGTSVFRLLTAMPSGEQIDGADGILAFTRTRLAQRGALYTFHKPFAIYVQAILTNELRNRLRKAKTEFAHIRSLDALIEAGAEPLMETDEAVEADLVDEPSQWAAVGPRLARLLAVIEELPRKRRLVAAYTLQGRPQFQLALTQAELSAPTWYPPAEQYTTDRQIAEQLAITDNSVRAHRNHAYQSIVAVDPELGKLFMILIDATF